MGIEIVGESLWDMVQKDIAKFNEFKPKMATMIGVETVNFVARNFDHEGFSESENSTTSWQQVKRREFGTPEYKYPKYRGLSRRVRKIGDLTGRMHNATKVESASFEHGIVVMNEAQYSQYFNDGTEHMVARPFLKDSEMLIKIWGEKTLLLLDDVFKNN